MLYICSGKERRLEGLRRARGLRGLRDHRDRETKETARSLGQWSIASSLRSHGLMVPWSQKKPTSTKQQTIIKPYFYESTNNTVGRGYYAH